MPVCHGLVWVQSNGIEPLVAFGEAVLCYGEYFFHVHHLTVGVEVEVEGVEYQSLQLLDGGLHLTA